MAKKIHIFRAGQHTAMNGTTLNFTEADLIAAAKAYNPELHEAPIVVGHPSADAPAYGWVKGLSYAEGLQADPHQVDVAFAEMVSAGRFKKVSASFYTPDAPSNPVPGVYYLRHVGFLGAQAPAVKGLKAVEFNEAEAGIINFADLDEVLNASLWRNLREFVISKFGLADADNTIPSYAVDQLEQMAQDETDDTETAADATNLNSTNYHEPRGDTMSAEEKAKLTRLEAENAQLRAQQKTAKTTQHHNDHAAFAESLLKKGTLLPTHRATLVAALDFLANQETLVEFSEDETTKPLLEAVKQLFGGLPKQVEFSELSGDELSASVLNFAAPVGYTVNNDRLHSHASALAYQRKHACDYLTAVKAVGVN